MSPATFFGWLAYLSDCEAEQERRLDQMAADREEEEAAQDEFDARRDLDLARRA